MVDGAAAVAAARLRSKSRHESAPAPRAQGSRAAAAAADALVSRQVRSRRRPAYPGARRADEDRRRTASCRSSGRLPSRASNPGPARRAVFMLAQSSLPRRARRSCGWRDRGPSRCGRRRPRSRPLRRSRGLEGSAEPVYDRERTGQAPDREVARRARRDASRCCRSSNRRRTGRCGSARSPASARREAPSSSPGCTRSASLLGKRPIIVGLFSGARRRRADPASPTPSPTRACARKRSSGCGSSARRKRRSIFRRSAKSGNIRKRFTNPGTTCAEPWTRNLTASATC